MKVLLARHGQTNYNVLDLSNADPSINVHLTKLGVEQAEKLARDLQNTDFEHIFISELRRTRQTAEIINQFHSVPITVDSRLNDNHSGYEGRSNQDYYQALSEAHNKWTVRFNDGESLEDVKLRVGDYISYLKTTGYNSILIVTSKMIVQRFYGLIKGLTNEEMSELEVNVGSYLELEV